MIVIRELKECLQHFSLCIFINEYFEMVVLYMCCAYSRNPWVPRNPLWEPLLYTFSFSLVSLLQPQTNIIIGC